MEVDITPFITLPKWLHFLWYTTRWDTHNIWPQFINMNLKRTNRTDHTVRWMKTRMETRLETRLETRMETRMETSMEKQDEEWYIEWWTHVTCQVACWLPHNAVAIASANQASCFEDTSPWRLATIQLWTLVHVRDNSESELQTATFNGRRCRRL